VHCGKYSQRQINWPLTECRPQLFLSAPAVTQHPANTTNRRSPNHGCCIHRQSSWLLQRRSVRCLFTSHPSTSDGPERCCPFGRWCWQIWIHLAGPSRRALLAPSATANTVQYRISAFDCVREHCPANFNVCIPVAGISGRANLRSVERHDMLVPSTRTQLGRRSFHVAAPTVWNALPSHIRSSSISRGHFRAGSKTHLFTQAYGHLWELLLKRVLFYIYIWHYINGVWAGQGHVTFVQKNRSFHVPQATFFIPPCIRRPCYGGSRRNIATLLVWKKLEWCGYPMVKKSRRYLYSFSRNSRTWRTDRQTDGHRITAYTALMHMHRAIKIIRIWYNLVHYSRYWTQWQSRDQKLKCLKFTMAAAAILKIVPFGHESSTNCPISAKLCMTK